MSVDVIRIEPAPARRRAFAAWAVAQDPKVRTYSPSGFSVPADLYASMPEDILIGATVDGHRYISPELDAPFVTPELSPHAPASRDDSTPGGESPSGLGDDPETDAYACPDPLCDRTFTTERGRDAHARRAHREG